MLAVRNLLRGYLLRMPTGQALAKAMNLTPLTAAEQTRFEIGKQLFAGTCAACHQPHGLGLEGLSPPLVDSEWVNGSIERLGRIAINGVRGPLKVDGRTFGLDMPAMGALGDDNLAAILTYIRREWGHTASPVEPATLSKIRAEIADRQDAWTEPELLKLPAK